MLCTKSQPCGSFVQGSRSPSASHRPSVSWAYKNCFLLIRSLGLNSELKGSGRSGVVGGRSWSSTRADLNRREGMLHQQEMVVRTTHIRNG